MKKKYQVFISSTFTDLVEARSLIRESVLRINCLPVGMEHFTASSLDQLTYIKPLIDDSDYYVLVIGGRYGSIEEFSQKSYTHLEYEYAKEKGKPILAFICKNRGQIPYDLIKEPEESKDKMKVLIKELEDNAMCDFWSWDNFGELANKVTSSLSEEIRRNPQAGWTRGGQISQISTQNQVNLNMAFDFTKVNNIILNESTETYIFATGATITVDLLHDKFVQNPNLRTKIKILLMNPECHSVKVAALRDKDGNIKNLKKRYKDNIAKIKSIFEINNEIECAIIDYLPPYNIFIFNPSQENAYMYVHLSGWEAASSDGRVIFTLTKKENEFYYNYFFDEFIKLWNKSQLLYSKQNNNTSQ